MSSEQGRKIGQRLLTALATLGGAVAGVVEAGIYPLVERYANEETTAGCYLGPEQGHSGSTVKDLKAYRNGMSILASRIEFWRKRLGNKANSFELLQKLSADALILLIELTIRKIREKLNSPANKSQEALASQPNYHLLAPIYYWLVINNLRLYEGNYNQDQDYEYGKIKVKDINGNLYYINYWIDGSLPEYMEEVLFEEEKNKTIKIDGITIEVTSRDHVPLILLVRGVCTGNYTIRRVK